MASSFLICFGYVFTLSSISSTIHYHHQNSNQSLFDSNRIQFGSEGKTPPWGTELIESKHLYNGFVWGLVSVYCIAGNVKSNSHWSAKAETGFPAVNFELVSITQQEKFFFFFNCIQILNCLIIIQLYKVLFRQVIVTF